VRVESKASSTLRLKLRNLGAQAGDVDSLLEAIRRHICVAAHDNIVRETDTAAQVRVLLAGTACAYKRREDGGRSILSFQHPGDFCDLQRYLLPDAKSAIGIQALTDCTVGVIDFEDMDRLLLRPTLSLSLWRASVLEGASYRERLSNVGRGTALARVAHLLCEQLARREAVGIHGAKLPFSQIDIADATALSIGHVNRTIQLLRSLNLLSKLGSAIEVVDRNQLEKIAAFDGRYLNLPSPAAN
jgi:CRP-like cAMP-binding protein